MVDGPNDSSLNTSYDDKENEKMNSKREENLVSANNPEEAYQNLLFSKLNAECQFSEGLEDLNDIKNIEDLMDIRDNPSYKIYAVLNDKDVNFNKNGYKSLSKEERFNLRSSTGVLLSLLFRKIIEKSLQNFEDYILKVPTFSAMEDLPKRHKKNTDNILETSLVSETSNESQQVRSENENEFCTPKLDILNYQNLMFPSLKVDMIYEDSELKFRESEQFIVNEFTNIYRDVLNSFNKFLQPEYGRIDLNLNPPQEDEMKTYTATSLSNSF